MSRPALLFQETRRISLDGQLPDDFRPIIKKTLLRGRAMPRVFVLLSIILLAPLTGARDKNKAVLPAEILKAQTVLVVINPEAGEPLTDPNANRRAQEDVERALMKWGRFRLVMDSQTADLVLAVRKGAGRAVTPTISGGPVDSRPVILQPTEPGDIRIGGQHGRPPDLSQPGMGGPQDTEPRVRTEVGPSQDTLEVYRGGIEYPLDSAPVWRYMAKDALRPPAVSAVEQFRKAIDEAERTATQKKPKQKP
jgi:hypothetical protein